MSKLSDKQKKKMIEDRVNGASIRMLATKYKCSTTTVQRVIKSDPNVTQKVTQKKRRTLNLFLIIWKQKKMMFV